MRRRQTKSPRCLPGTSLLSLLLLTALATACGEEQAQFAPISVRLLADLSAAKSSTSGAYHAGREDHLREINRAGGLQGREILFESADTGGDVNQAYRAYLQWKGQLGWADTVTLFADDAETTQALLEPTRDAEMPVFPRSLAGRFASPVAVQRAIELEDGAIKIVVNPGAPSHYPVAIDESSALRGAVTFMAGRGRSVAFIRCAPDLICSETVEMGRSYAAGEHGMSVLDDLVLDPEDSFALVRQKVRAYLARDPVDWLWLGSDKVSIAAIVEALDGTETRLMAGTVVMHEQLDSQLRGRARARVYGVVVATPFGDMVKAQVMPELVTAFHRYDRPAELATVQYAMGYASVALWSIAVERLLARGDEVSRTEIKAVMDEMVDVQTGGLLQAASFSIDDHRPSMAASIYWFDREGTFRLAAEFKVERRKSWLGW